MIQKFFEEFTQMEMYQWTETIHKSGKCSRVQNKPDHICTYLLLAEGTAVAPKVLAILGMFSPEPGWGEA